MKTRPAGPPSARGRSSGGLRPLLSLAVLRSPLSLSVLLIGISLLVTWRFPVYFHWDDVSYLRWAQTHPNPLSAFRPSQAVLFGTFRPLNVLTWWVLYRLLDLRAPLYQLLVTLAYGSVFVSFFLLARRLHDERTAWFSLLGYAAIFLPLTYVMFWFSDLTFILEVFWINLALYFLASALTEGGRRYLLGIPAALCAFLTKEPSVPIITSALLLLAWTRWRDLSAAARRRVRWLLPLIAILGAVWLLSSPGIQDRQGIGQAADWREGARFLATRWRYYASELLGRTGILLGASAFFLAGRALLPVRFSERPRERPRGTALLLLIALGLSLALRRNPGTALLLVAAAGIPVLRRWPDQAIGWAWGFLPLLAFLTLQFYVRTYLFESSFGFALVFGVAASVAARSIEPYLESRLRPYLRPALALAAVAAIALGSRLAREKIGALTVISANRQNFRDVSEFLLSRPPGVPAELAVVHYGDMDYSYRYGVRFMPDEQKGGLQKTMEPFDLPVWFRIRGHPGIHVYQRMKDFMESGRDSCWVWAMNNHEKAFLHGLPLKITPLYEVSRKGEEAGLYRVERTRP